MSSMFSHASSSPSPWMPHLISTPTLDPIHVSKKSVMATATSLSPYFISPLLSAHVICCCDWYLCIMLFITSFSMVLSLFSNLSTLLFRLILICFALSYLIFLLRCVSSVWIMSVQRVTRSLSSPFFAALHTASYWSVDISSAPFSTVLSILLLVRFITCCVSWSPSARDSAWILMCLIATMLLLSIQSSEV